MGYEIKVLFFTFRWALYPGQDLASRPAQNLYQEAFFPRFHFLLLYVWYICLCNYTRKINVHIHLSTINIGRLENFVNSGLSYTQLKDKYTMAQPTTTSLEMCLR